MVASQQNVFLENSVLNLIVLDENIFPNDLDGEQSLLQFCKVHFAKRTFPNQHLKLEVFILD